jgi:hypothetical protein
MARGLTHHGSSATCSADKLVIQEMPHRVYSTPSVVARLSQLARAKRFAIVIVLPSAGSAFIMGMQ